MNEKDSIQLINLLADIYSSSPKDHNPKGFIDEFLSRIKASINVNTMREFYSKLMRKLKCTDIYDSGQFGLWIQQLDKDTEKEILQELRDNTAYYVLMAKEYLNIRYNAIKEKQKEKELKSI